MSKISICCTVCGKKSSVTDPYPAEDVVVNNRAHLAIRTIWKGRAGLATFSGMMGIAPPITSKHNGTYNQRLGDATDPVREANMSAVASCLRKDAAPDEVIDVMVTCDGLGLSEATQLSLEWCSLLPGRPDRCRTWRSSAGGATSARRRRRSVLTPHRLSFWIGGRCIRICVARTLVDHLVRWRRRVH